MTLMIVTFGRIKNIKLDFLGTEIPDRECVHGTQLCNKRLRFHLGYMLRATSLALFVSMGDQKTSMESRSDLLES